MAEADLLRRLRDSAAGEADLRHMLRRRDLRIEELKREQAASDRLSRSIGVGGGSGGGPPWSSLAKKNSHRRLNNASITSVRDAECSIAGGGGAASAAVRPGGRRARSPGELAKLAERAAKEVSQAAVVLRLELELAEAAAGGDVGDATARAAERLARRLLPEEDGNGGGGGGTGGGACHMCGRPVRWWEEKLEEAAPPQGRGASFLMPSVEVERKASVAAAAVAAAAVVVVMDDEKRGSNSSRRRRGEGGEEEDTAERDDAFRARVTPSGARNATAVDDDDDDDDYTQAEDCSRRRDETLDRLRSSKDRPRAGRGDGETAPVASSKGELSHGVQQLEAQLARLEAVSTRCGFDGSADDAEGRLRSASPRGRSRLVGMAWVDVVRELRTQVAALRDRAEGTEELLNVSVVVCI